MSDKKKTSSDATLLGPNPCAEQVPEDMKATYREKEMGPRNDDCYARKFTPEEIAGAAELQQNAKEEEGTANDLSYIERDVDEFPPLTEEATTEDLEYIEQHQDEFKDPAVSEAKARISEQNVRRLPFELHPRAETGALQFKDDYPGLFIRGDSAMLLAFCIDQVIKDMDDIVVLIGANKLERVQARSTLIDLQKTIYEHVFVGRWKYKPIESVHDKVARAMEQVTVEDLSLVCEHVISQGEKDSERSDAETTPENSSTTADSDKKPNS